MPRRYRLRRGLATALCVLASVALSAGIALVASPSSAGPHPALDLAPGSVAGVTVSGQVTDGSGHGWPMYAKISVQGDSRSTFTDPVTGRYSIELPEDTSQTLVVEPQYPGYATTSRTLDVGSTDLTRNLELTVGNCETAPGYRRARIGSLGDLDGRIGDFLDSKGIRNNELSFWHEDPSLYDVIILNDPGDPRSESLLQFLDDTDAAGTGVVFLDTRPSTFFPGTGIMLLWRHLNNPSSRGNGSDPAIPYLYYKVTQAHAILDGFEVGDEIVFDETSGSKYHSWFSGYEGEGRTVIADAARADTGVLGSGIAIQERPNNRHVLLSMHGEADGASGPSNWTPDAAQIFVNALEWASDTSLECQPVSGGLVVGNVTDANTGAGVAAATVTDADNPSGGVIRTSTIEGDPAHGQGFHWRFVPQTGNTTYRASVPRYVDVTKTVDVRPDAVTEADFALPAGRLDVDPSALHAQLRIGQDPQQHSFTITNTGTAPATVELTERRGGFETLALTQQPAEVRNIPGHFTPNAILSADQLDDPQAQPEPQAEPSAAPWANLPSYPHPIQDNSAAVLEDKVYSFGGFDGTSSIAHAYTFDPVTGRWDPIASLPQDRTKPEVVEHGGLIYILGGWSSDEVTNRSVFVYDPASDTYRQAASMPAGRAAPGAAVVDGKIYVVGGCTRTTCTPSNTAWRYDPATDSWETLADYPETVSWLGCAGLQGRLYCAGGFRGGDIASASTYEYDPATDTWSRRADLLYDNWAMAYAAANGQFVVSGGVTFGRSVTTNRGAAYDPATDRWTEIEPSNQVVARGAGACGFYKIGGEAVGTISSVEVHPGFDGCPVTTDVPWLTVTPQTVTLQPGEQVRATVQLDATMDQPGTFTAGVGIRHGTPYPVTPVGVTAAVTPPNSWGKITGTVIGIDCLGNEQPLASAIVRINFSRAQGGVTRFTDADGEFAYWIAATNNPLDVTVSSPGYVPESRTVRIMPKGIVVEGFALQRVCGTGGDDPQP